MSILLLIPTVLSLLVLAAHFLRSGSLPLVAISLLMIGLVFVKRAWAARTLQVVLVLAALEWVFATLNLIQERQAEGRDWARGAMILIIVALVNVFAAFLYRSSTLAKRYRLISVPRDDRRTDMPSADTPVAG